MQLTPAHNYGCGTAQCTSMYLLRHTHAHAWSASARAPNGALVRLCSQRDVDCGAPTGPGAGGSLPYEHSSGVAMDRVHFGNLCTTFLSQLAHVACHDMHAQPHDLPLFSLFLCPSSGGHESVLCVCAYVCARPCVGTIHASWVHCACMATIGGTIHASWVHCMCLHGHNWRHNPRIVGALHVPAWPQLEAQSTHRGCMCLHGHNWRHNVFCMNLQMECAVSCTAFG
jgi:hypothetical protein